MSRIEDDIKSLIFELAGCRDDERSLKYCCTFMREVLREDSPTPQPVISSKIDAFVTKFDYLGFPQYAQQLSDAIQTFLPEDSDTREKKNESWLMLDLMLQLSSNAFKPEVMSSLEPNLLISRRAVFPEEITEEEKIDWFKYLLEGSEKFKIPENDEDSDDEFIVAAENTKPVADSRFIPPYNDLFEEFKASEKIIPDEKAEVKRTLKEALDAESSLVKSVQHSWWNGDQSTISSSIHSSANFGRKWEIVRNEELQSNQEPQSIYLYHDEYKIIRELLWILIANDKRVLKRVDFLRTQTSIPSLIQETFAATVDDILNTAEKYHSLTSFCNEILGTYALQVTFTLQAYAFAVKDICSNFLTKIIELESIVKEQDSIYTLLTLHNDLEENLRIINFIFEVHKECGVSNWMEEIPWICAVRLLSVLLSKYQEVSSKPLRQILLRIFFKTFKIYAEIIDVWLTEGKLNDWKNEFFIQNSENEERYVAFPFPDEKFHGGATVSPLFHHLSEELLNCYQSIDFLCKLNKTRELKTEILKEGKLLEQFIGQLKQRTHSRKVQSPVAEESEPILDTVWNFHPSHEYAGRVTEVPYLVRAFGDQLCVCRDKINLSTKRPSKKPDETFGQFEVTLAGPLLEQVLHDLIKKREAVIVKLFRIAIVDDYKFFDHIRNLKDILLMDWSGFCNRLSIQLGKQTWVDHNTIRVHLYDCVERNKILLFGDLFRFTIDDEDDMGNFEVNVSRIIKAIDRVTVQYEVQWPLNMIFTPEIMNTFYAPLLKLVLKIRFAFSTVARLRFKDIPQLRLYVPKLRRVQVFRHWVMLLLEKLHSYLLLAISQSLDCHAVESGVEIETFTTLLESYTGYLNKTKLNCLIENEFLEYLSRALNRIWFVCDDIVHLWTEATKLQVSEQHVLQSVELYVQCLWYLTRILEKFLRGELGPRTCNSFQNDATVDTIKAQLPLYRPPLESNNIKNF